MQYLHEETFITSTSSHYLTEVRPALDRRDWRNYETVQI